MNPLTLEEYLQLPYKTQVQADTCGDMPCFFATHPELLGCSAMGFTWQEALDSLKEAQHDYLEVLLKHGWDIPLPEWKGPILRGTIRMEKVGPNTFRPAETQ